MILLALLFAWLIAGTILIFLAYRSKRLSEDDHTSAIERRARNEMRESAEVLAEEVQAILKEEAAS